MPWGRANILAKSRKDNLLKIATIQETFQLILLIESSKTKISNNTIYWIGLRDKDKRNNWKR